MLMSPTMSSSARMGCERLSLDPVGHLVVPGAGRSATFGPRARARAIDEILGSPRGHDMGDVTRVGEVAGRGKHREPTSVILEDHGDIDERQVCQRVGDGAAVASGVGSRLYAPRAATSDSRAVRHTQCRWSLTQDPGASGDFEIRQPGKHQDHHPDEDRVAEQRETQVGCRPPAQRCPRREHQDRGARP